MSFHTNNSSTHPEPFVEPSVTTFPLNEERLRRVADSVDKVSIRRNHLGRPVASFIHTDFVEPITASLVDDMALSLIAAGVPFHECDVIVSVADKIAGSLAHSISLHTNKPYTLANWYPEGSPGDVEVEPSAGFSGTGVVYLNGLKPGMKAVFVDDSIVSGSTSSNLIDGIKRSGARLIHTAFVVEVVEGNGRERLKGVGVMDPTSLIQLHVRGERTKVRSLAPLPIPVEAPAPYRTLQDVRKMGKAEEEAALDLVERAFIGIPIVRNPTLQYPYSFFQLTDFKPLMTPDVVETMAELCILQADITRCDVIVSEADRGGGPLAQAVAARLRMPYVLATWSTTSTASTSVQAQVGFSGVGRIFVNGLQPGMRAAFIDDMLSSGGTAEGVLRAVEAAGGIPVEGVFVSEKLYPERNPRKGHERLLKSWPMLSITTLVQFIASGDETTPAPKRSALLPRPRT